MTLATIPRYERNRLSEIGDRAVVVGESIAGLLSAFNRYLDRLIRKAHTDGELRQALYHVFNMERPPYLAIAPRGYVAGVETDLAEDRCDRPPHFEEKDRENTVGLT